MNTQKSVYNRLFSKEEKTELETHKVQLSLSQETERLAKEIDNLKKSYGSDIKKASKFFDEYNKMKTQEQSIVKNLDKQEDIAAKLYNSGKKQIDKFEKIAKDIGVNPKDSRVYIDLKKATEEIEPLMDWRFTVQAG